MFLQMEILFFINAYRIPAFCDKSFFFPLLDRSCDDFYTQPGKVRQLLPTTPPSPPLIFVIAAYFRGKLSSDYNGMIALFPPF